VSPPPIASTGAEVSEKLNSIAAAMVNIAGFIEVLQIRTAILIV
jgi:hypothetical protein